jgi:hypothetical protein
MTADVIPFRRPAPAPAAAHYLFLNTIVVTSKGLEEGDLVAFCWAREDGTLGEVLFDFWEGPTGRDCKGRFVKKGSPEECCALGRRSYRPGDVGGRLKILGAVAFSRWDGECLPAV